MERDVKLLLNQRHPNQKINYDKTLQKLIQHWQKDDFRPNVLLHSCCAPCSTYTLEYLTQFAEVTIYFANSNIHPRIEFERRKQVQEDFIEAFNQQTGQQVGFIAAPYEPQAFVRMVKEKNLQLEPEGGKRCQACFNMRLDLVAQKCQELGFDYFGSALTLSPKKNSQLINELGIEIQEYYEVYYLPSDFKKNKGYERSIKMCKDYDIYRQCYCGCVFAAKDQGVDFKEITKQGKDYFKERTERHS